MTGNHQQAASERGRFIVFEGGDGCGKSTQASRLADRLDARLTREPGGTAVGSRIRALVLDPNFPELADRTEALLMAADRAQHVHELIVPTLNAGQHVVSDRHVASSLAYQGVGRGLGVEAVLALNRFAVGDLVPDLVVLLDVDAREASERLGADLDRIEAAGSELAEAVRQSYHDFASEHPDRWSVVDGNGTPEEVGERVAAVVQERLGLA